jgi:hypothetical protein
LSDDLEHELTVVREELERQREDARAKINRGIVMIAVVPLVILIAVIAAIQLGGLGLLVSLLSAVAYTLIGTVGGVAMIASGAVEHRRAGKQLDDYVNVRQLPEARVVIR